MIRVALLLTLLISAPAGATRFFVDQTLGLDANDGLTEGTAWKTLAKVNGISTFAAGDIISLKRGETWAEQLTPISNNGTAKAPITFNAYGHGAQPIISFSSVGNGAVQDAARSNHIFDNLDMRGGASGTGFRSFGNSIAVNNVVVQNCTISGLTGVIFSPSGTSVGLFTGTIVSNNVITPSPTGLTHSGIEFTGDNVNPGTILRHTGFIISGNTVGPAGEDGIIVENVSNGIIEKNVAGGNGENSIDVKDGSNIIVRNNVADNDTEYNIVFHDDEAESPAPKGQTFDNIVEHNTFSRGGQGGTNRDCLFMHYAIRTIVRDNDFRSCYGAGILVNDATAASNNNEISFNMFDGDGAGITGGTGVTFQDVVGGKIFNNAFYNQKNNGDSINVIGGANTARIQVQRNIVSQTGTGAIIKVAAAGTTGFKSDHNILFPDASTAFIWSGGSATNFASWKTNSSGDAASTIASAPKLMDYTRNINPFTCQLEGYAQTPIGSLCPSCRYLCWPSFP